MHLFQLVKGFAYSDAVGYDVFLCTRDTVLARHE